MLLATFSIVNLWGKEYSCEKKDETVIYFKTSDVFSCRGSTLKTTFYLPIPYCVVCTVSGKTFWALNKRPDGNCIKKFKMPNFKSAFFFLEDRPYVVKYAKFIWMSKFPGAKVHLGRCCKGTFRTLGIIYHRIKFGTFALCKSFTS